MLCIKCEREAMPGKEFCLHHLPTEDDIQTEEFWPQAAFAMPIEHSPATQEEKPAETSEENDPRGT